MTLRPTIPLLAALLLAAPAWAEDPHGTLNPDEMSMERMRDNAARGQTDMTTCASGYLMTKSGRHGPARETFEACAGAGYTAAMTWMGTMDQNGLAGDYDPERAAEWNRRAAEAGDPVGQLNHGLDLLRGYGVARDEARGRVLIDRAAEAGDEAARRVRAAGYDPEEATPDADEWRYKPMF